MIKFIERPPEGAVDHMARFIDAFVRRCVERMADDPRSAESINVCTFVGALSYMFKLGDRGDDLLAVLSGHTPDAWRQRVAEGKAAIEAERRAAEEAKR